MKTDRGPLDDPEATLEQDTTPVTTDDADPLPFE